MKPIKERIEAARNSLLEFTKLTYTDYRPNWHHELVCDYLDKFARLEIKRLMVLMPPRHGKSELVSRRLPAYILGKNPDAPIITASYGADLARRMNRDVQRIIDSPEYQYIFPKTKLWGKNIKTLGYGSWLRNSDEFEIVEYNGYYRGAGVGGAITGMGMRYGIIDDPVKNRQDANSPTIRQGLWDWYVSTFRTRLAPGGGILITVTTWHEDGLEAKLLKLAKSDPKADQWTVLRLPAIAEAPIADYDIRNEGEALWPSQYSLEELEATKVGLGSYEWSSLYQQRPQPDGGAIFKKDWWAVETGRNRYDLEDVGTRNRVVARWLTFDTAFKDKSTNDMSACTVWELWPDYRLAVRAMWAERIDSAFLPSKIEELAHRWNVDGKLRAVIIEDKGSGITSIQTLRMSAPAWLAEMIVEFQPTGTKEYRARLASVWCEKDCIILPWPGPEWYPPFLDPETGQLWMFPNATHDDMVDSFVMGILYLENFVKEGWHARNGT